MKISTIMLLPGLSIKVRTYIGDFMSLILNHKKGLQKIILPD